MTNFLIVGNFNSVLCREIFPLFKDNQLWFGWSKLNSFNLPDGSVAKFGNTRWYTNIGNRKVESVELNPDSGNYIKYDNYDAVEIGKVSEIPDQHDGIMGVPISYLDHYNPEQFEIIWQGSGNTRSNAPMEILKEIGYKPHPEDRGGAPILNGKRMFSRVFIRGIKDKNGKEV